MADEEWYEEGYDPDNVVTDYYEGDFVIDLRWSHGEGEFEIGIVYELEEDGIVVSSLKDDSLVRITAEMLPYIQIVGDAYYDKEMWACCKGEKEGA